MAKKKHPKLPNGFGSIKKLSGTRSNPYAVYPPTTEFNDNGSPVTPKALCYVSDWYTGFYALMEYKNGTFNPDVFVHSEIRESEKNNNIINKIIASYNRKNLGDREKKTFSDVYNMYYTHKYERPNGREYSQESKDSTRAAFKNCSSLHDHVFTDITAEQLQKNLDDCPLKHSSKELILSLYKQMYKFAYSNNLCDRDISIGITINIPDDDEPGVPFSEEEINIIWSNSTDNTILQGALIMIYSGFRIAAYKNLVIDMENQYFKGGVKTAAGKERCVPFNKLIIPLINPQLELFNFSKAKFRKTFEAELEKIGINGHTPHDCRHTFSWLCDKYKIDTLSKKMLMGHAIGKDITDSKYGHRTLDELRTEINKITR